MPRDVTDPSINDDQLPLPRFFSFCKNNNNKKKSKSRDDDDDGTIEIREGRNERKNRAAAAAT
jgi:hypothetical protein